jgi:plastocyanin
MRLRYGLVAVTLGVLGLTLVLAACGGGGGASGGGTTVTGNDQYKFDPANLSVKANQPVTITFRNTGSLAHNWTVQGLPSLVVAAAAAGQTGTVTFTPTQTGTFKIVCTEPGHEASGMVGQLTVTS